jgi:Putative collagen-binding domain of a collagenase
VAGDRPMDVLESAYVTAARTPDGRYAVVYVPGGQSVDVDRAALAPGVRTDWVDPASGAVVAAGDGGRLTPPGANSQGDRDWLLLVRP